MNGRVNLTSTNKTDLSIICHRSVAEAVCHTVPPIAPVAHRPSTLSTAPTPTYFTVSTGPITLTAYKAPTHPTALAAPPALIAPCPQLLLIPRLPQFRQKEVLFYV